MVAPGCSLAPHGHPGLPFLASLEPVAPLTQELVASPPAQLVSCPEPLGTVDLGWTSHPLVPEAQRHESALLGGYLRCLNQLMVSEKQLNTFKIGWW